MKKTVVIILTVIITVSSIWGISLLIEELPTSPQGESVDNGPTKEVNAGGNEGEEPEVEQEKLKAFKGTVQNINVENGSKLFTIQNIDNQQTVFLTDHQSFIFANSGKQITSADIKMEDTLTGYVDPRKPVILIYPPQYYPELLVVTDTTQMGEVAVGFFDENFVNDELSLKLNISDETKLIDQFGELLTIDDLAGKQLAVFYTVTTRSIPAQTTPSKIIAFKDTYK